MDRKDLKQITDVVREEISKNNAILLKLVDVKFETGFDKNLGGLEKKMFEWKSEIVGLIDGLAQEIRDEREFREISSSQTASNTRRIGKLEHKVFGKIDSEA